MELDPIDIQILNLLQKDAKITNKQLSLKLNLSTTAIYERIKKMERVGVIKRYAAVLDREALGKTLMVFAQVALERHSKQNIDDFEAKANELPEVLECYHISGEYDYLLKMTFESMDAYREFIVGKLMNIQSIGNTHSIFVMHEVKNEVGYQL